MGSQGLQFLCDDALRTRELFVLSVFYSVTIITPWEYRESFPSQNLNREISQFASMCDFSGVFEIWYVAKVVDWNSENSC